MNLLTDHIEYLLNCHDCVVVPGFGAFIAQYQSAKIDEESGLIIPPCRCVAFNASLIHNDGLLASSVARQLEVSYDCAVNRITKEASQLRMKIYEEGKINLGKLGGFRSSSGEGTFEFLPAAEGGINAELYGLRPVEAMKTAADDVAEIYSPKTHIISRATPRHYFSAAIRIAAAVTVIIALAFSFIKIVPSTETKEISYASFSLAGNAAKGNDPTDADILPEPDSLPLIALSEGEGMAEYQVEPVAVSPTRYYLIVASFPNQEQARTFISASKDSSLKILDSGSRSRVYAASGATLQDALNLTKSTDISERYNDVWIHHQ